MEDVVIVAAGRTAVGKFRGALAYAPYSIGETRHSGIDGLSWEGAYREISLVLRENGRYKKRFCC